MRTILFTDASSRSRNSSTVRPAASRSRSAAPISRASLPRPASSSCRVSGAASYAKRADTAPSGNRGLTVASPRPTAAWAMACAWSPNCAAQRLQAERRRLARRPVAEQLQADWATSGATGRSDDGRPRDVAPWVGVGEAQGVAAPRGEPRHPAAGGETRALEAKPAFAKRLSQPLGGLAGPGVAREVGERLVLPERLDTSEYSATISSHRRWASR